MTPRLKAFGKDPEQVEQRIAMEQRTSNLWILVTAIHLISVTDFICNYNFSAIPTHLPP